MLIPSVCYFSRRFLKMNSVAYLKTFYTAFTCLFKPIGSVRVLPSQGLGVTREWFIIDLPYSPVSKQRIYSPVSYTFCCFVPL